MTILLGNIAFIVPRKNYSLRAVISQDRKRTIAQ